MHWDTKVSPAVSARGNKYAFTGVCKDTRVTVSFLGASKTDFIPKLKGWINRFENEYPFLFHFDQGTEQKVEDFIKWLEEEKGIKVTFSATGEHNQNPYAERKIGVNWELC